MTDLFWTSWQAVVRAVTVAPGSMLDAELSVLVGGVEAGEIGSGGLEDVGAPGALGGRKPGRGENRRT